MKLVQEAIRKVQIGTDKTAAELAITRFQREMNELQKSLVEEEKSTSPGFGIGCGGLLVFIGLSLASTEFGLWALIAGIFIGGVTIAADRNRRKRSIPVLSRIGELERLITEKQRISDS